MCRCFLICGLLIVGVSLGYCAPRSFELAPAGRPRAAIVVGEKHKAAAEALQAGLQRELQVALPVVTDEAVVAAPDWRLKDEWLSKPLILLGNVADNRAMFVLFSKFLEGANALYPGPGRYSLRVLFSPLQREVPMLCLGASDEAGLQAGTARVLKLAAEQQGAFGPVSELGDAGGVRSQVSDYAGDFGWCAGAYYWDGNLAAGRRARELLLTEIAKPDPWGFLQGGHYDWERTYRPLREVLASGLLSPDEQRQVDERLAAIALNSTDWAGVAVLNAPPRGMTDLLSRHPISALIAHFILYEYLTQIGEPPADKREALAKGSANLRAQIGSLIEDDRFMSNEVGTQGVDNLSFMADAYLLLGDSRVVQRGIFRRMADFYLAGKDSLGYQAGDDAYITCRPGCQRAYSAGGLPLLLATYFHGDGQFRWLLQNTPHFMSHMQVPQPPEIAAVAAGVAPEPPLRYSGLTLIGMDPWWYRRCSSWKRDELMAPLQAPVERSFTKAVFRDGYEKTDGYLLLQGVNLGAPGGGEGFCGNSVMRYTDLGSILLFANTIKQTSWARSVVSASRGEPDPQSIACVLGAHFSAGEMSGLQSTQEEEGGLSWRRSIIHRARGYFVVLDTLTARAADTYNLTCRWRSLHPGELVGPQQFAATDGMTGVQLHLQGAGPASWEAVGEPIDGAARPTVVRQFQRLTLQPEQSAVFQNLLYAADGAHRRTFELRRWTPRAVLISGSTEEGEQLAAAGEGPLPLKALTAEAALWHVSREGLVLAGATKATLAGRLELAAETPVTLALLPSAAWIEVAGPQPALVTLRGPGPDEVLLDGQSLGARRELAPGRHAISVKAAPLLGQVHGELSRAWAASAAPAAARRPAAAEPKAEAALTPLWTYRGMPPEFRRQGAVLASAQPPVQIGNVESWRDTLLGPPSGYGWHGSERAGWLPGTEGTVCLDLGSKTSIRELRLVRSRGPQFDPKLFSAEGYSFTLQLSDDNFAKDVRRREIPRADLDVIYRENAHYMYTIRFPVLVVPVGEQARYVRLTARRAVKAEGEPTQGYARLADGTYSALLQDREMTFMEVEVVRQDREARRPARLWCEQPSAGGGPAGVLYQAGQELQMLSPAGKLLWRRDLGSLLAADPLLADADGDGRPEIVTFSLAEELVCHDLRGEPQFRVDIRAATRDEETSGMCSCRPACLAAWRPNADKRLEYLFFPHYACYRVTAAPELAVSRIEHPGYSRGGKFAFTVPDVTGDGKEELAVVGLYGFGFGVIPSETPLEKGELPSYLGLCPLTGYSSGNQEFRLYHDGAVVRDRSGAWLGVVALNPGGVDFFVPQDFKKRWSHFTHAPNLCKVLADLTADGKPELLVGREDGYVVAYEVEQGKQVAKVALDGPVRALAVAGGSIAAGTDRGLTVLDSQLRRRVSVAGPVESLDLLAPAQADPLLIAAHSDGRVCAYRLP